VEPLGALDASLKAKSYSRAGLSSADASHPQ